MLDLCLADTGLPIKREGPEGPVRGDFGILEPVDLASLLAVDLLLDKKTLDDLGYREALLFRSLKLLIEGLGHPLETQVCEELMELVVHISSSSLMLKKSPATWERIICSSRERSYIP